MMIKPVDRSLIFRARRKRTNYPNQLTPEQAIAINLFRRDGTRAIILARAFGVSKNTIYYRCLKGEAASYQDSPESVKVAKEANRVIDSMGFQAAWEKYVTQDMVDRVEAELKADLENKAA
jgi:Zn-dependent peptidase ImmA (M78 family)